MLRAGIFSSYKHHPSLLSSLPPSLPPFLLPSPTSSSLQTLSTVISELNMLRANSSENSIGTEDALRYLKAAQFNSIRAIEMYKNYQVSSREGEGMGREGGREGGKGGRRRRRGREGGRSYW